MLYLFLITIYLLLFALLSYRKTDWAIYLLIFALPSYLIRFHLGPIPATLLELMIIILFLVWLIKTLKQNCNQDKKYFLFITHYSLPITLFLVAATISIFTSPHLRAAAGIWKAYFIEPILFLVVFINIIDRQKLKKVFLFSCFLVFLLSCFAIFQKFTGAFIPNEFWAQEATRRVTSIFPYPNALALFLTPLITLFIGLLPIVFKKIKIKKLFENWKLEIIWLLYLVSCILGLFAIYFTKSKGALLAILASLIFYAIFYKPYRKYFISCLGLIFITLLLYYFITQPNINLHGQPTVEGGDSISTRLEMWQETWHMLKTKPIFGAGLAGYQTLVAPFHQKDYIEIYLYPHNIILNFWSELGLLGLIAFVWIIILFYTTGFKEPKQHNPQPKINNSQITNYQLRITILASMTALLIHGLVDVPYFKNDLSILFWLIIGSIIILNKHQDTKTQPPTYP